MQEFVKSEKKAVGLENDWYRQCEKARMPFIVVRTRRKFAEVSWDCITIPRELEDKVRSQAASINRQLFDVFSRHCNPRSRYEISTCNGSFDNLLPSEAEAAAAEIFHLLSEAIAA